MKQTQWLAVSIIICLSFFLNIERLDYGESNFINISSFVYLIGIFSILLIISLRPLWRINTSIIVSTVLGIYLACKLFFFSQPLIGDIQTYVSISEITLLTCLAILTQRFARSLGQLEKVIESLTLADGSPSIPTLDEAVKDVKVAMHLSRRHKHPLSVVVVDFKAKSLHARLNRALNDLKQIIEKRYLANCFARILNDSLRRSDQLIAVPGQNRFIVLCHETKEDGLKKLLERIKLRAAHQLGISVACGSASFPNEALTFEDLLSRAEHQLEWAHDGSAETAPVGIKVANSQRKEEVCDGVID